MRTRLFTALTLATLAISAWAAPLAERAHYELIISAKPFGDMAAAVAGSGATMDFANQDPEKVKEESNKIQLCAMTETPDGDTAVGLIDNGANPPGYITLFDGESSNGLELLFSDLDDEIATFRRDGVTFTLGLGLGLVETVTPELYAQRKAEAEEEEKKAEERERKRPNSLAEQLIAMQMSLPPDVEAPPLPIPPMVDAEEFTRPFNPDKPDSEPETETEAVIKEGAAQLKESAEAGETPQEYLKRLVAHRQKEVERQQTEKKAAQKAIDEALAAAPHTPEEEAALRRKTNIDLLKKGVVPLTPVDDLTPEEQAEVDAALEAL